LQLTHAGQDVVSQVVSRRRTDVERLVAATPDLWKPEVITALTSFAAEAGEMPDQGWWLGWDENPDEESDAQTDARSA
jgi:hypothetical protein